MIRDLKPPPIMVNAEDLIKLLSPNGKGSQEDLDCYIIPVLCQAKLIHSIS